MILSVYKDLEEIDIDQSVNFNCKLLQTLGSAKNSKKKLIQPSHQETISQNEAVTLWIKFEMWIWFYSSKRSSFRSSIQDVEDIEFFRMNRGYLSPSSIVLSYGNRS